MTDTSLRALRAAIYDGSMRLSRESVRRRAIGAASVLVVLAAATGLVALFETSVGIANASSAYLLAIIALAVACGTTYAIVGALGAFLVYDFLFVEPIHTFQAVHSADWLNLLLLLVVGLVVGRLAGGQRRRAELAELREHAARGLFEVGQAVAEADDMAAALARIVSILRAETRMSRVWIGLVGGSPLERVAADTGDGATTAGRHSVLVRQTGNWIELHTPLGPNRASARRDLALHRVPIDARGQGVGSLWALRPRPLGVPAREETRLLAAAADQIGQAIERDRLRAESTSAEIARQSDALKSALVDTVSHDFRTPLATIRAAAGNLERSGAAALIDRQAAYLDRLVTNLLDLSRIEAGQLRATRSPILLDDLVADVIDRLGASDVTVDAADDLPAVLADDVHVHSIVTNLLENARAYAPDAPIRIRLQLVNPERVRLTVEDGGAGVRPDDLARIFEKFYRGAPGRGSGIGLAVVRGLAEAGDATIRARTSDLGGLAIDIDLPVAASVAVAP